MSTTQQSTKSPPAGFFQIVRTTWTRKTGIDWKVYKLIFKGAATAAVGLACYQATPWANLFSTFGYLVPVASIIAYPMPPRAQFLRAMFWNFLFVLFATGVTALALFCVVKAREHTSNPANLSNTAHIYNSSASAVAALWMIVQTFAISSIRAKYVAMAFPCSAWLVFSNFGMIYGTRATDMPAAMALLRRILYCHLVGFGLSIGVSLLIFPTTNREAFYGAVRDCIGSIRSAFTADLAFMENLSKDDEGNEDNAKADVDKATQQLTANLNKLTNSLSLAKEEIVTSKLHPGDLDAIRRHLEDIAIPLISLGQLPEASAQTDQAQDSSNLQEADPGKIYSRLLAAVIHPWAQSMQNMNNGVQYALEALDSSRTKTKDSIVFEKSNLISMLQESLDGVFDSTTALSLAWSVCQPGTDNNGSPEKDEDISGSDSTEQTPVGTMSETHRRHLYVILYAKFLLWSLNYRVLNLVMFADEMKTSISQRPNQLLIPPWTYLKNFSSNLLRQNGVGRTGKEKNTYAVTKPDPSHLPPTTTWERRTHLLRAIPRFLASSEASFGLRVVAATMSIAIVAFLHDTQEFYIRYHLIWAQYAISFCMQTTAGQGLRHFTFRLSATVIAVMLAWISWYIVVGHRAGVLIFYFIFMHFPMTIILKHPRFAAVGTVSAFALTIIVGDKLQLQKLGKATSEALGLAVQPMYLIGAIRLAALSGGMLLASIWTIIPYPISEHQQLRRDMSKCLESIAHYHAMTSEALHARISGKDDEVDDLTRQSLHSVRCGLFTRCTAQLQNMNAQLRFIKWEIPIGGPFPRALYEQASAKLNSLLKNTQLLLFASASFTEFRKAEHDKIRASFWFQKFQSLTDSAKMSEERITALLMLLSNSISTATPLPPHVRVPPSHTWSRQLCEMDHDLLDTRNIAEPGHATYAIIQIGIERVHDDLEDLLRIVKDLVGEMEFSYTSFEQAPSLEDA